MLRQDRHQGIASCEHGVLVHDPTGKAEEHFGPAPNDTVLKIERQVPVPEQPRPRQDNRPVSFGALRGTALTCQIHPWHRQPRVMVVLSGL